MSVTSLDLRAKAMDAVYEDYAAVQVLAELAAGRKPMRGTGRLDSPVMVIGEAPGAEEEKQGVPFIGPSGQLLRKLFDGAGIPWNMCYVTNAVAYRPPGNRTPYPFQLQGSEERLAQETDLVDPVIVVAAGASAWRTVTRDRMGKFDAARFRWHSLNGRRLLCIPHPAAILRLGEPDRSQWKQQTVDVLALALAKSTS